MSELSLSFLGLEAEVDTYENAGACILPVPFERTTSYGQGTRRGPEAILKAYPVPIPRNSRTAAAKASGSSRRPGLPFRPQEAEGDIDSTKGLAWRCRIV